MNRHLYSLATLIVLVVMPVMGQEQQPPANGVIVVMALSADQTASPQKIRDVLVGAWGQRYSGSALLPDQRSLRELLGGSPGRLISTSMSHTLYLLTSGRFVGHPETDRLLPGLGPC